MTIQTSFNVHQKSYFDLIKKRFSRFFLSDLEFFDVTITKLGQSINDLYDKKMELEHVNLLLKLFLINFNYLNFPPKKIKLVFLLFMSGNLKYPSYQKPFILERDFMFKFFDKF